MANINTGVGSLGNYNASTNTYGTAGLLQKAYDKVLDFKLRSEPLLRSVADKKPGSLTNNSNQVIFQIYKDLAVEIDPLDEATDPDTLGMETPDYVAVLMKEYGNMVARTKAMKLFSFTDVDPAVANIVAYNMIDSIDKLVANVLVGGSNVLYGGDASSRATLSTNGTSPAVADTLGSAQIRKAVAKMRTASVAPRRGSLYWVGIHPEVSHDLRVETDAAGWRTPQNYQATDKLWAGEIGQYEGAYYIESPRMPSAYDGASTGAGSFTNTGGSSGTSTAFVITLTAATTSGVIQPGYIVSGTGVGSGARVVSVSADGKTITVDVANSGSVSGTITFQPTFKVYRTLAAGQQALAEAVAEEAHSVVAPVTDNFGRFHKVGWYFAGGWALYRPEALWRIESVSSIA
jgi:N4-gp56 family major capsid protein